MNNAYYWLFILVGIPVAVLLLSIVFSKEKSKQAKEEEIKAKALQDQLAEIPLKIQTGINHGISDIVYRISHKPFLRDTPVYKDFNSHYTDGQLKNPRFLSAMQESMNLSSPIEVSTFIIGSTGQQYKVSLSSCTCPDFQHRHHPCKHMYRLAIELGLLIENAEERTFALKELLSVIEKQSHKISNEQQRFQSYKMEQLQTAPHLASLWAEYEDLRLKQKEDALRYKAHAAPKAADQIREIRAEKRVLVEENRLMRHQLDFLTANLPWLEDYMELTVDEVHAAAAAVESESEYASEYESLHRWLSQEEYLRLSDVQKYQLAFDRYKSRSRSNWEAGIDYERYVGYLFEKDSLQVKYSGALTGKEDMGRDLIVGRGKNIKIVQCKRYAKEKQIHENTVFQLYGSCVQYQLQHPGTKVTGAIYTTTMLSDVARACAQEMGIELYENFPLKDYPMIKCNIGNDGIKRFHLPFSQMYDRLHISPAKGDFYAATVQEAMDAGFVKAKRWTGNQ